MKSRDNLTGKHTTRSKQLIVSQFKQSSFEPHRPLKHNSMKFSARSFTLIYFCSTLVSAERIVRLLLNNGLAPTANENCTDADNRLLDVLFNTTRRNLRSTNGHEQQTDRQLFPLYCRDYCRGYVKGTCRATNCKGYRRELSNATANMENPYNVTCPMQTQLINATLNTMVSTKLVSSKCRNLLKKPRLFQCYDDIVYGEIESIKVFDKEKREMSQANQYVSICKSKTYYVEVVVNECVDELRTRFINPKGLNFTIPSSGKFPHTFEWWIFPGFPLFLMGNYSIQYIPDGIESKSKAIIIENKDC